MKLFPFWLLIVNIVADGFGKNGRSTTDDDCDVPPNANLEINLELVSWKTVSDITNDKKVLKKILLEGDGYDRPSDGATVHCKLHVK